MANCTDLKIQVRNKPSYVALYPGTIEKTFTDAVIDLKEIVVLAHVCGLLAKFRCGIG